MLHKYEIVLNCGVFMNSVELLEQFSILDKEIEEMYHEIALNAGLSDSAHVILYAIVELGDGCLQKQISQRFFISKQTLSSCVKKLEADNIIYLENGKGREVKLFLTNKGQEIVNKHIIPLRNKELEFFSSFSEEQFSKFLTVLRGYLNTIKQVLGDK